MFYMIAALIFMFFSFIWRSSTPLNVLIKYGCLVMTLWGFFEFFVSQGYVFKA